MSVPIPVLIDGVIRLSELVKRLIESGRDEATDEEVEAATARRKGALSELEEEIRRRRGG